ncbi:hypothetical protein LEP1GSC096_4443 [Leptospira interrogans serovar Hebdomadis str. R499]|uniref:Uncharacterized protein n=1 Tax=Leptospira interrogans serovar Zanoni str. LT2156 TaxID=1001601 RepID=M6HPF0_LEPIR|nr:hypothetical protein LEP1GSC019_1422 [Leptospira interrogans serovar Pyrogenes str. 2006006960]EKR36315.1 hypothetical protein LEP1GSC096_4443 [Leptospira interrogans serovar Hebdomadis str. R499]EKR82182.1 hypothetical protein LEP1GSC099_2964 [Leptospira interrogans str. UI 08452]EMM96834.1 hypothetical protein LEP1GSC158_5041 [Leptospira interrogans serovar Zanoni str. LT2156]EMN37156.1 hypothetical protein LEP1GSC084_3994 [Leptospira interrogans serovar Medanensis str. L0448]EMN39036.1 h
MQSILDMKFISDLPVFFNLHSYYINANRRKKTGKNFLKI